MEENNDICTCGGTIDRSSGRRNVPHVGKQPRARTQTGTWRRYRCPIHNKKQGNIK